MVVFDISEGMAMRAEELLSRFRQRREVGLSMLCDLLDETGEADRLAAWFEAFVQTVLRERDRFEFDADRPDGGFPGDVFLSEGLGPEDEPITWFEVGPTEGILRARRDGLDWDDDYDHLRELLCHEGHVRSLCERWVLAEPVPRDVQHHAYETLREHFPTWSFHDL